MKPLEDAVLERFGYFDTHTHDQLAILEQLYQSCTTMDQVADKLLKASMPYRVLLDWAKLPQRSKHLNYIIRNHDITSVHDLFNQAWREELLDLHSFVRIYNASARAD